MNETIQETHSAVKTNLNKKTNGIANIYAQNTLDISRKETNRNLNFLSELKKRGKVRRKYSCGSAQYKFS